MSVLHCDKTPLFEMKVGVFCLSGQSTQFSRGLLLVRRLRTVWNALSRCNAHWLSINERSRVFACKRVISDILQTNQVFHVLLMLCTWVMCLLARVRSCKWWGTRLPVVLCVFTLTFTLCCVFNFVRASKLWNPEDILEEGALLKEQ